VLLGLSYQCNAAVFSVIMVGMRDVDKTPAPPPSHKKILQVLLSAAPGVDESAAYDFGRVLITLYANGMDGFGLKRLSYVKRHWRGVLRGRDKRAADKLWLFFCASEARIGLLRAAMVGFLNAGAKWFMAHETMDFIYDANVSAGVIEPSERMRNWRALVDERNADDFERRAENAELAALESQRGDGSYWRINCSYAGQVSGAVRGGYLTSEYADKLREWRDERLEEDNEDFERWLEKSWKVERRIYKRRYERLQARRAAGARKL